MEAFIAAPVGQRCVRHLPSKTRRRGRALCVAQARSLDSYREGSRWSGQERDFYSGLEKRVTRGGRSGRRREDENEDGKAEGVAGKGKKGKTPKAPKTRVALTKALSKMNVASLETCAFLVRGGCVRVNGVLEKDDAAKINKFSDRLSVNGVDMGVLEPNQDESDEDRTRDSDFAEVFDTKSLPRAQRDLRRNKMMRLGEDANLKKYNRRIDGGFYSGRRYDLGG